MEEEEEHQQPCITLDPSGDVRLSTDTQDFLVSSKSMCLASPVWRAMLDPQGPWAKHKQSSGVLNLPEDDPNALLILLRIAHLQFSELPDVLVVYEHLLQLAVLCDKYDAVHLVRPWISKWQAQLQAQAEESGYEGYESWLFIAWTFGDEVVFKEISCSLVLKSTVTTVNGEPRLVNARGDLVGGTVPPGSIEAIIEARSERISALLKTCYKLLDRYEASTLAAPGEINICVQDRNRTECDSLVYGCLIKGLQSLNLFPKRLDASEVKASVMDFADKLRSLKCLTLPDIVSNDQFGYRTRNDPDSHCPDCNFTYAFASQIESIVDQEEPSGVLEAHLAHINGQKGKSHA